MFLFQKVWLMYLFAWLASRCRQLCIWFWLKLEAKIYCEEISSEAFRELGGWGGVKPHNAYK